MELEYDWEKLTIIGTSEGPDPVSAVDFTVGPALARTEDGGRFVITDARVERPQVRTWIEPDEYDDLVSEGVFAVLEVPWPARRNHVVVSVSKALAQALSRASLVIPATAQEELESGWRLLYVALSDLADVRVRFSRFFLDRVNRTLKATHVDKTVADDVWRELAYACTIARDGSLEHTEATIMRTVLRRERLGADAAELARARELCRVLLRMDAATLNARLAAKRRELGM